MSVRSCSSIPSDLSASPLESAKTQLAGCDSETIHDVIQLCLEYMKIGIIDFLWKTEDVSSWGNKEQTLALRVEQISAPLASFLDERIRKVFANPSLLGEEGYVASNIVEPCDNFCLPIEYRFFVDLEKMRGNNKLVFFWEEDSKTYQKGTVTWHGFDLDSLQTDKEKIISVRKKAEKSWRETRKISFVMQRVLLGKITPDLQKVSVSVNAEKKEIDFYFYYDHGIFDRQNSIAAWIREKSMVSFPDFSSRIHIEQLNDSAPLPFLLEGERTVYKRYRSFV